MFPTSHMLNGGRNTVEHKKRYMYLLSDIIDEKDREIQALKDVCSAWAWSMVGLYSPSFYLCHINTELRTPS